MYSLICAFADLGWIAKSDGHYKITSSGRGQLAGYREEWNFWAARIEGHVKTEELRSRS